MIQNFKTLCANEHTWGVGLVAAEGLGSALSVQERASIWHKKTQSKDKSQCFGFT